MTSPIPGDESEAKAVEVVGTFARDLLDEANRIAKRAEADTPSAKHIERAAVALYRKPTKDVANYVLTTLGSLVVGIGASAFVAFYLAEPPHRAGSFISLGIAALGTALVVAGITRYRA